MADNYFELLNSVNVNDKTEKKNGLTYLSWAYAWGELKKKFPDSTYTIYENKDGWNYHTDGRTCWVKTGVTVNGIEHIEYLPVMDYRNASIPINKVTSYDVNKAIQRSLTKSIGRHGIGLYLYAGEDYPEDAPPSFAPICECCGNTITSIKGKDGKPISQSEIVKLSMDKYGMKLCADCMKNQKGK